MSSNSIILLHRFIFVFFVFFLISKTEAQQLSNLKGVVKDENGNVLQFATVRLYLDGSEISSTTTNNAGTFSLLTDKSKPESLQLEISFVNKATKQLKLNEQSFHEPLQITLESISLTLNDVVVTGEVKKQNSASSIVFSEEAIRQLQAFSLADVLNTLPGKKTEAPNLQNPQTISFRTSSEGADAINNSFGIAIFIDGVRISNETNMQSRGLSSRGLGGSLLSGYGQSTSDVTYNGFDLRDIPMSNIESIEIIQGVGSARYGDFTNGAILITTKAGKTPYSISTNINGGSTAFSVGKGLKLPKNYGALNFSLGYTNSNNDPRDKVKSYDNLNAGLKWTKDIAKNIRNSLSINGSTNLDKTKADPDDDAERMSYSKRRSLRLTNNSTIDLRRQFLDKLSIIINYSTGKQESYTQWLLNGMPKGLAGKDTTGVYEGYFIPGNYLAVEQIDGVPVSYGANIDMNSRLISVLNLQHQFSFGLSLQGAGNLGKGNIVDPNRPRWTDLGKQNERPYSYQDSVRFELNTGLYFQDNIRGKIFNRHFNLGLGFRLNIQDKNANPQPRLSLNYRLTEQWSLSTSYGISTKSPSLAHLYPSPTYFDIPLLNLYTGYTNTSLFLVYTEKVLAKNENLKNAVTYQFEQGVSYNSKIGSGSLFAFYKKNKNGFNTYTEFIPTDLPVYDYYLNPDNSITYFPTGNTERIWDLKRSRMNNGLQSTDYGFQLLFQTKFFAVISTSFGAQMGYTGSKYTGANLTTTEVASNEAQQNGIVYVSYNTRQRTSNESIISFSSNTHIPRIGFIITLSSDYQPLLKQQWEAENIYPVAYTTSGGKEIILTPEEAKSPDLVFLRKGFKEDSNERNVIPSKGFWNLNMRVSKEIKKDIRFSISAYNVLNMKPKAYKINNSNGVETVGIYNYTPLSITAGISLQL